MGFLSFHVEALEALGARLLVRVETPRRLDLVARIDPRQADGTAMIDTGSAGTIIRREVAEALGLPRIGSRAVQTATRRDRLSRVHARVIIPGALEHEGTFLAAPLPGHEIDVLLGRDLLARAVFLYDGVARRFTLRT